MISCIFLDELFFVFACPVALLLFSFDELFGSIGVISSGIKALFFIVYSLIVFWTLLLYVALFHRPEWVKRLLLAVFRIPLLYRWKGAVETLTDNLVISSHEMSHRSLLFWLNGFWDDLHFMDVTLSGGQCIAGCFHDKRASIIGFCQAAYSLDCDDCQSHTGW